MKHGMVSSVILTVALWMSSPAWAEGGYRLIQLNDEGDSRLVIVTDLNNRGEVVGSRSAGGNPLTAFVWRNGEYTNLHEVVAPGGSEFTQAAGINDRSTIVGYRAVPDFEAFVLRDGQVTPLPIVPGEINVFPTDINNRGQIIVDSYGGPQSGSFFVDRGRAELLPGLNTFDTMYAISINDRGAVLGTSYGSNGIHPVLWSNGALTDLGVVGGSNAAIGTDLNNRNQAVGYVNLTGGEGAFIWRNGKMKLLPPLPLATERFARADSINDFGAVAGQTLVTPSTGARLIATLWIRDQPVDLNTLIRADDPRRSYVHLENAKEINNRGDIVATGIDSRDPTVRLVYFLTLLDEQSP
jgi:uncharacterized membrane protein